MEYSSYAEIFDTIDTMSFLLVSTSRTINRAIRAPKDTRKDEIKKASAEYNELLNFYFEHGIYLDRVIVEMVNSVLITWRKILYKLWSHEDSDIDSHGWMDAQDELVKLIHDEIDPTVENLKRAFRVKIGVHDERTQKTT